MATKKDLEKRLKSIASVGKIALRVWRAGVENEWKASGGYITILMQLGDLAEGRKLPKGTIKSLRRQAMEYVNIRKAQRKAQMEAL